MAIQLLGLVLWLFLAVVGAWLLVTGRPLPYQLPNGLTKAWHLRLLGLISCMLGAYLAYRLIQGSFEPDGIVMGYLVGLATIFWVVWDRRRKAGNRSA